MFISMKTYFAALWLCATLSTAQTPPSNQPSATLNAYLQQAQRLVAAHRSQLARLDAAVTASANALVSGGSYYVCCEYNAWPAEAYSRAGGTMGLTVYKGKRLSAKDVVWVSYTPATYQATIKAVAALKPAPVVVWFGPMPPESAPGANYIDSLTKWSDADNLTQLANVLSLWEATGELAAATAHQDRTLVFWQSIYAPNAATRNARYSERLFHQDSFPKMAQNIAPGTLSGQYLDYITSMIDAIAAKELPAITAAGQLIANHYQFDGSESRAPDSPVLAGGTHLGKFASPPGFKIADLSGPATLNKWLKRDGILVYLGYYGPDREVLLDLRSIPGAHAIWLGAAEPRPLDFAYWGDSFINEHWDFGDGAVSVPGYDVPILPASGVAELLVYELLLRAAH